MSPKDENYEELLEQLEKNRSNIFAKKTVFERELEGLSQMIDGVKKLIELRRMLAAPNASGPYGDMPLDDAVKSYVRGNPRKTPREMEKALIDGGLKYDGNNLYQAIYTILKRAGLDKDKEGRWADLGDGGDPRK